jgi:hypothetical protein
MQRLLNKHTFLLVLCGGLALLFLMQAPQLWRIRQVGQRKQLVEVEVLRGSTFTLGKRSQSYLSFRYAEQTHSVRVSHAFRQRVSTLSTTVMLHLPEYPDLFLPPDYDFKGQLFSYSALITFFLGSAGYSIWMLVKED